MMVGVKGIHRIRTMCRNCICCDHARILGFQQPMDITLSFLYILTSPKACIHSFPLYITIFLSIHPPIAFSFTHTPTRIELWSSETIGEALVVVG